MHHVCKDHWNQMALPCVTWLFYFLIRPLKARLSLSKHGLRKRGAGMRMDREGDHKLTSASSLLPPALCLANPLTPLPVTCLHAISQECHGVTRGSLNPSPL
ncbi:coilin [Platysternon megacephalum]|uniref:Coilin n=1 Tax=Platysternon megacephalum TaxID=55544 RepID=A0A4D9DYI2_9SAUR|nr:coilin [Platysternon megacephalum]